MTDETELVENYCCVCGEVVMLPELDWDVVTCGKDDCVITMQKHMGGVK